MEYRIVNDVEIAKECDNLLTELIMSERKYDKNVRDDYSVNDYFTKIYDKDYNVLICALSDNNVVGFIYGFLKYEKGILVNESVGFIDALYVKEKYRKQGIATHLIEEFYKWCDSKEIKFIEIGSYVNNEAAYNFYKKLGFEVVTYYMKKEI